MKKYKNILVIGNGFDLDLGLKTRFSDFAKSQEWKRLYCNTELIEETPILQYLYGKSFIDNWFDIERSLYEYARIRKDGVYANKVDKDKEGYRLLCKTFSNYLKSHVLSQNHSISNTKAGLLLTKLCSVNRYLNSKIYTFNYTPIELYASVMGSCLHCPEIEYLHGTVENDSIILGIENVNINSISPDYSFLYKTNNIHYKSTHFISDITEAKEVIIFGHSVNEFDYDYFREFFSLLTRRSDKHRNVTFIDCDEFSKNRIFDNIRRQGINVTSMFQYNNVDIVFTSKDYEKDTENAQRFITLLERI